MEAPRFIQPVFAIVLAPLLLGVVNRVKAVVAGRRGPPLLQAYFDIFKLLRKGAVYSRTTTWVFRAGPIVSVATALVATALLPVGGTPALMGFPGDLLLLAYLLGLARFFTVLAALDTGSAFEGMGASREVQFSALAEPALLLALAAVARNTGSTSLTAMVQGVSYHTWAAAGPALALISASLLLVFLAENARIPVDDPNTHLELTMIHEVMVLDHGGPDFAFILYGAALKLWVLGAILVGIAVPVRTGNPWLDAAGFTAGMLVLAVVVGAVESSMARLKLLRVPQLLTGAAALAGLALILVLR